MTEKVTLKEKNLVKEVEEKFALARDKKDEAKLHSSFDKWENYYNGTSAELEKRDAKGLSAIMPAWAQAGVDYVLAKEMAVIFGQKPYWGVRGRRKKYENAAKLQQELLMLRVDQPKMLLNIVRWIQHKLIYGSAIRKPMWDRQEKCFKCEYINPKNFYPSPDPTGGYTIYEIPWAMQRSLRTREYIEEMGKPWKGSRKSTYKNTVELLKKPGGTHIAEHTEESAGSTWTTKEKENIYEILEYWDRINKRVVTIGERKIVLRDTDFPYEKKKDLPFMVMIDWPHPKSFWGTGRIESVELMIRELAHIKNQRFDNVNLILNPPMKYLKGVDIDIKSLPVKPNAMIGMDDLDAVRQLWDKGVPFVTEHVYREAAEIEKEIQNRLGLHEYWMGRAPEQRETATGIARLQAAGNTIFQAHNLLSIWLGMQELAAWISAIDQQFLKESIAAPFVYDADARARGEYFDISKSDIAGEFIFEFKPSPINPEVIADVERGQFVQAIQTLLSMQAEVKVQELGKLLLERFNIPQSDIDKILPETGELPGVPPGGATGAQRQAPRELSQAIAATMGEGMGVTPPGPK